MYWKDIVREYPDMYAFITDEKECDGEIETCKLLDICTFEEKSDFVKKYIDSGIKFLCLRTTPKLPGDIKTLSDMKSNERLLLALHKAIELKPDIELGKLIRYAASIDDLAYMSDEDLALQIEGLNKLVIFEIENDCPLLGYKFHPNSILFTDEAYLKNNQELIAKYDFTKENEKIAYDRYKASVKGKIFFDLYETVNAVEFIKRFDLHYVEPEYFKGYRVINHCSDFLNTFPIDTKYFYAYIVCKKDNEYIAKHIYACKLPCFGELFHNLTINSKEDYDEIFAIALDYSEVLRFTNYTNHVMFGVATRSAERVIEVFTNNQAIEMFHELFQKSVRIESL